MPEIDVNGIFQQAEDKLIQAAASEVPTASQLLTEAASLLNEIINELEGNQLHQQIVESCVQIRCNVTNYAGALKNEGSLALSAISPTCNTFARQILLQHGLYVTTELHTAAQLLESLLAKK